MQKNNSIETSFLIEELTSCFEKKLAITTNDLEQFFHNREGRIKRNTLNWRIFNFVKKGILTRIDKGLFRIGTKIHLESDVSGQIIKINNHLKRNFPLLRICVWDTSVVRELSKHVPSQLITIVDVERDGVEAVFHNLQEKYNSVFLMPDKNIVERYVTASGAPVIVKVLISEAPVTEVQGKLIPSVEKILVDILFEKEFLMFSGTEMGFIFRNAFESFPIRLSKMIRYANRKRKKDELIEFLILNKIEVRKNLTHK